MEKAVRSTQWLRAWAVLIPLMFVAAAAGAVSPSHREALRIGKKVWQNECNGTVAGLTSWNGGEEFASLGIGHFIWYPEGKRGPFEESFPKLVAFMQQRGAKLPDWLRDAGACPWRTQAEFQRARSSPRMNALRRLLASTVDLQAEFLVDRLRAALPKMLDETAPQNRENVQRQFERLTRSAQGCYALIDYVNFKGEGVLHTERYHGEGWGLLQVLEQMRGESRGAGAVAEFSRAAAAVLTRRVANSPPERHESRWLPGWLNRVRSYTASE